MSASKHLKQKEKDKRHIDLHEIVTTFWPQINFRVRRSLGTANQDWEDVAANILVDALKAIKEGKFRRESSIGTFIYVITSRRIIDYIRIKTRRPKHSAMPENFPASCVDVKKKQLSEFFLKCIKRLNLRHADMIYLHYYLGCSQSEIAQVFGISVSRVGAILKKARESLKKIILYSEEVLAQPSFTETRTKSRRSREKTSEQL